MTKWTDLPGDNPDYLTDVQGIIEYAPDHGYPTAEFLVETVYLGFDHRWRYSGTGDEIAPRGGTVRAWQPLADIATWSGWRAVA